MKRRGYTAGYGTRDGHFLIENGLAGMTGGARTPWVVLALTPIADVWLQAAELDGAFRTKRDAAAALRERVYASPDGWAHHTAEAEELAAGRRFGPVSGS